MQTHRFSTQRRRGLLKSLICWMVLAGTSFGQQLFWENPQNYALFEREAIAAGAVSQYFSTRLAHNWDNSPVLGDEYTSTWGTKYLRGDSLQFFPYMRVTADLNGGAAADSRMIGDISPSIMLKYQRSFADAKYKLLIFSSFEKHTLVSDRVLYDLEYALDPHKGVGYNAQYEAHGIQEYDVAAGGIGLLYPDGEVWIAKTNPIWGPGYTGQLGLSDKAPNYLTYLLHHRISRRWRFTLLHSNLNSDQRASPLYGLLDIRFEGEGPKAPFVPKYVAAHKLDFYPVSSVRLGFSELIIYSNRLIAAEYVVGIVPYWSVQHDLGDADNLLWIADFEWLRKDLGRVYGSLLIDEWDLLNTFNADKSHNWFAWQLGSAIVLPIGGVLRLEYTRLSPYVYVHRDYLNSFEHYGQSLGYWTGPNSDTFFAALEKSGKQFWGQIYLRTSRKGTVNPITIAAQYHEQQLDFLHLEDGDKIDLKSIMGFRGRYRILAGLAAEIDINYRSWTGRNLPYFTPLDDLQKWDLSLSIIYGI